MEEADEEKDMLYQLTCAAERGADRHCPEYGSCTGAAVQDFGAIVRFVLG